MSNTFRSYFQMIFSKNMSILYNVKDSKNVNTIMLDKRKIAFILLIFPLFDITWY